MNIKNITTISSYLKGLGDNTEEKDVLQSLSELVLYRDAIAEYIDNLKNRLDFTNFSKISNNQITVSLANIKEYDFKNDLEYLRREDALRKRKEFLKKTLIPEIKQQIKLTKNERK